MKLPHKIKIGNKIYKVLRYDPKKKALLVSLESIAIPKVIGKLTGKPIEVPTDNKPFYLAYPSKSIYVKYEEIYKDGSQTKIPIKSEVTKIRRTKPKQRKQGILSSAQLFA